MSIFTKNPALRWAVPVVAVVALTGGGAAISTLSASADSGLAARTPAQLLADVEQANVDGLSGTIVQNAALGLPALPGDNGQGSSDLTSLVSGSHTLRVWYDGSDHIRLALLGTLGESDVIRNGSDLWTWSSHDKTASHHTLPSSTSGKDEHATPDPTGTAVTPQQAADQALAAIGPTTKVTADGTTSVAGRAAYELVLRPRETGTMVGSVHIAIDGRTHIPTRVQVYAKGAAKPAFDVGFSSFNPTRPDASVFRFNPPPGTTVTKSGDDPLTSGKHAPSGKPAPAADATKVVGNAWTSVLVTRSPLGQTSAKGGGESSLTAILGKLPKVSGAWGSGHLLQGTLFSALLTDDGRLVVGAVSPDALYQALAPK